MKYNAIIFDLDRVICHTDQYHYKAWKEVADELNIYFDEQINNRLRGVSRMESFEIILERYEGTMTEEEKVFYTTKKNDVYKELLKEMTPQDLSAEVEETLTNLRESKIKLAIGSSSKNARFILERIGLIHFFDVIVDGNDITHSKPAPEVFVKAVEALGEHTSTCLVIEDAPAGVEAARGGGIDCAGLGEATQHPEVTYILSTFSDMIKHIS